MKQRYLAKKFETSDTTKRTKSLLVHLLVSLGSEVNSVFFESFVIHAGRTLCFFKGVGELQPSGTFDGSSTGARPFCGDERPKHFVSDCKMEVLKVKASASMKPIEQPSSMISRSPVDGRDQ